MTRYFELNVVGRNGFSAFVKTDKELPPESSLDFDGEILNRAADAKVIDGGDAKDIMHGAGTIEEVTLEHLTNERVVPENMIHKI